MGPFDRFNDRAKRVLALAQDEAIRMHHSHLGVEHLALGLIREGEGIAARTLDRLGIDLLRFRTGVESAVGRGDPEKDVTQVTLTPRVKRVLELAIEESKKLGHSHIGTEHLLLAMAREGESVAAGVLRSLGAEMDRITSEVMDALNARTVAADDARGAPAGFFQDAEGRKRDWYCEDVLSEKLPVRVLYEDALVLGFDHPYPVYRAHGVVIPKRHIAGLTAPEALDGELLEAMLRGAQHVAIALGIAQEGFRLEANANAPGVTPHMHWHVAGPGLPPPARR